MGLRRWLTGALRPGASDVTATPRPPEAPSISQPQPHDVAAEIRLTPIPLNDAIIAALQGGAPIDELARIEAETVELPPMPSAAAAIRGIEIREVEAHVSWIQERYHSCEPIVCAIPNALVLSSAGIAASGGSVIAETLWHTRPDLDRYRREGAAVIAPDRPMETLAGTHVSLLCGGADNYFHSLIESLARLSLVPDALVAMAQSILLPRDAILATDMLSLYEPAFGRKARLVGRSEILRVEHLILPGSAHGVFDFHPRALGFFDRVRGAAPESEGAPPRRVYLDRRRSPLRRLLNEDAVIAALAEFGFEPVRAESLSAREQVALFRGAEAVVGPHGAGLANLGFVDRGCVVLELMMDCYVNWCFRRLAAIRGAHYDCVFGRAPRPWPDLTPSLHQQHWEISIDETVAAIRRSLALHGLPER